MANPARLRLVDDGGVLRTSLLTPPRPNQIDVNPSQWGAAPHGMLLLWGSAGRLIFSLDLRFEDGTTIPIRLHHGWALYQVNPRNFIRGHRPVLLLGRDQSGRIIDKRPLGPYQR